MRWRGTDGRNNTGANSERRCDDDGKPYCFHDLPKENLLYARVDAVANFPEHTALGEFMREVVDRAERRNRRLVIDLRDNPGGSGDYNRAIFHAILQSPELNQYGRTYVLTSRRTFSAAQLLVSHVEYNTRAIFVGEPTGARPTHYGDANTFVLDNSKLAVRISTLQHMSPLSVDRRVMTAPHYKAAFSADDHFSGGDPALELIAELPNSIPVMDLFEHTLKEGGGFALYYILIKEYGAPDIEKREYVEEVIALADRLATKGETDRARTALGIASFVYRGDERIASAMEALDNASAD